MTDITHHLTGGAKLVAVAAGRALSALYGGCRRVAGWVLAFASRPGRLLAVAWLVGLFTVGAAGMAHADGLFSHPTYTDPQQTLFEAHGPFAYTLTIQPDDDAQSGFGLTAALYQIVGVICNLLLWIALLPLYGAFLLLEWFLNLTFYRDNAAQIDTAVQTLANQVFWPLISATVAVGAVITYTRWRSEGRGWLSDIAWVIAAATLAIGFVTQPSQIMLQVDSLREQLAAKVITGTTTALTPDTLSVTGYQNPALTGPQEEVAARSLVAGLWDSFGSTPWCLAQFHELDICRVAGAHKLAGDDTWKQWESVMADNGQVTEFGAWQDWVRGMDLGRLGYVLILLMMALPMAILTLILVIAGFSAVVGFAAMFLLGVVALIGWPIPGWFRRFGTKWWEYTLGLQLQALFVTVILAAVMLVSMFIGSHVDTYGFFIVGLLNIVLMFWAVKARAFIESLTMMGGGGNAGMLGTMAAWTGMRAGGWALGKVGHLGRQVIRSPYNTGRYIRDRAKGIDWTGRPGQRNTGIPTVKHVDTYRIPDLDQGPRQLPPPPPPAIGGGPAQIGPPDPSSGPLVPRPPSGGPPATRPSGPRRPPPSPGGHGPVQAPYRRDPRRPATPLPQGPTAAGHDGRRQLGTGHTSDAAGGGRRARDTRNGQWVTVSDATVVEPATPVVEPATRPAPPSARPAAGAKPAAPVEQGGSGPRPEPRRRRIARTLGIRHRSTPLDDGPAARSS
jgi:hypothetical protein